jgi:hypothetical protein
MMTPNKLSLLVLGAFTLCQSAGVLRAQTNLANALDATNLVWTTGGTGGVGWSYHASSGSANDSFDGIASAQSGHIGDSSETWIQTTVVGPGTVSFWWQAYSEPNADWLQFSINGALQSQVSGGGDAYSSWASGWLYNSFQVPAGTNVLKWRYVKDASSTGGTLDTVWVDQVSYVTSPPPPLEQALNTSGVVWSSSGSTYTNGWFAQTNVTHDGQLAAQSGAIWHSQTNWLQATVSGMTNVSFWWKVSSELNADYLEFYVNGVLAGQISGEVNWQNAYVQLPAGTSVLTWQYRKNDTGTAGSNCGWLDQVTFNTPAPGRTNSSTVVAASTKTPVYGQAVTFTATVSPSAGSGTPTGTVTFSDGATILGSSALSAGKAAFSTTVLSAGAHSITASYSGDGNFNGSSAAAVIVTVSQASSSITLTPSPSSAIFGQPVTFKAMVSAVYPGIGTPSGTVTFKDGTTTLGTATLSSGQATFISTSLSVASHTLTAVYAGDSGFKTSTSTSVKMTISKAGSSTAVTSPANPSAFGQAVSFTATVSPAAPSTGTPTGTVQFKTNGVNFGSAVTLSGGQASSASVTSLPAGKTTTVTAVYNGDTGFNTSTSLTLTQSVNNAATATTLASSASASVVGQPVIFSATVTAAGGGTPTGTVKFMDGTTAISTNTLSGGVARYTNSTLALGSHSITAIYNGVTGYNGSDSTASPLAQTVGQASTSTTVSSSLNPSVIGQSVSFTATVNAVAPGAGTRTGTVQFSIDGSALGSPVSLSSGKATSGSISTLALGSHTVTASYSGDANFMGSDNTASPLSQVVNKPSPSITITSSKSPSSPGDPVTWTAKVSASGSGATPTGSVQFIIDGANFDGAVTLSGGSATSLALATLAAGSHTIAVAYSGDANYNNSTSANFSQTVNTSPVTPATGGNAISADTIGGSFTSLTGPSYKEASLGAVGAGTIILKAPAGFVFDTGGVAPTVKITGSSTSANNINDAVSGTNLPMTSVTATQITFTVTAASAGKSGTPNTLTWQNIRVGPTAGTPLASGIITKAGTSTMTGVATNTSFGFLAEAAGAASAMVIQASVSATATAGVPFAQQPALQIQDQFGNARTYANRNADNSTVVTAALSSGSGALQGTLGVTAANGLAAFSDLSASMGGTTVTIQFSSGTLASVISGPVVVSSAPAGNPAAKPGAPVQKSYQDTAVTAVNVPPTMQGLAQQPDGSMEVRASGVPGQTYLVQACEQLGGAWATISSSVADANGKIVFLDANAKNYNSRFYRLATP